MHPITKQILGHELKDENHMKVEYHLKSNRGRTVMTFDHEEHARLSAVARGLDLYRVITIIERL